MKRSTAREMMDVPGQARELLAEDLANLRRLNRYLGCYRSVISAIGRLVAQQEVRRFTLLDAGAGSGDVGAAIARWARRRQIEARVHALEREPVTVEQAAAHTRAVPEVDLVQGDAWAPPFRPGSFDFVLASQLLHHFTDDQIVQLLRTWARLARRAIIVADLVRHPLAYHGIRFLTHALTRNEMTRCDAPLSVRRACTMGEWRSLIARADVGAGDLRWKVPFRMLGVISLEERR
jgi:SAM-dependent methyltransferase